MTRRAEAVRETRERVVDAAVAAHRELGIQATSWDEIARRAGVGVGTVYRHFRSYDELLPACGEVVTEILALPTVDEIPELFGDAQSVRERIGRLVGAVFDVYERGAPFIENVRRERDDLPQLDRWHVAVEEVFDALTRDALRPASPDRRALDVTRALTDLSTWNAFRARGFSRIEAVETVSGLITAFLSDGSDVGRRVRAPHVDPD